MQEILDLRADYNSRREPEGVTSENAFGKRGEISDEMRNFGVAVGWGGLPKESLGNGGESQRRSEISRLALI